MSIARTELRQLRPGLWWTSDVDDRQRVLDLVLVLGLCLLAFGLRLHQLDARSMWLDEGFTTRRISLSMAEIITNRMPIDDVVTQDLHPALYFILLKLFSELGGTSLFVLKYVGVAWAVVLVPLFFASGRLLLSPRAGRAAALFAALSPVYLWYAQDLRMYTQLAALSLLAVYTLVRASQRGRWWRWMIASAVTAALAYTHYSGLLVALFEVVTLAIITYYVGRARRFIGLALALLSTVPLIILVLPRAFTGFEPNFPFVPLDTILRDLLNSFSVGISVRADQVWWLNEIFLVVVVLGVLLRYPAGRGSRWLGARWLLLGYLVLPLSVYYLATYVKPAYQGVRHLFIVSPAFYLLLARGVDVLAARVRSVALLVLLVAAGGMAYSTEQYFRNPRYMKDDWRGLVRYVEANAWPRDAVVVNNTLLRPVLDTYNDGDGLAWVSAPEQGLNLANLSDRQVMSDTLNALRAQHPRIWFIPGLPVDGRDNDYFVESWLKQNMTFLGSQQFPGLTTVVSVHLYASRPLAQPLPVTAMSPAPANPHWQGGLQLVGYQLRSPGYVMGGNMIPVQLAWRAAVPPEADQQFSVQLSLIDPAGTLVDGVLDRVVPDGIEAPAWSPDQWLLSQHTLFVPPGAPPGQYRVQVSLRSEQRGVVEVLSLDDGSTVAEVGTIPVIATTALADVRRMPNFTPQAVRFDPGVELVGYRATSAALRPGQLVAVQLCWRALRDAPPDTPVALEIVDEFGRRIASGTGLLSVPGYETRVWKKGQIVMSTVTLRVHGDSVPGQYRYYIRLAGSSAYTELWPFARPGVELGPVQVAAWPFQTTLPGSAAPHYARFGDGITLAGYQIDAPASVGGVAVVTLFWRADAAGRAEAADMVAYVHLLPGTAGIAPVLHDAVPVDGLRPLDTWRAGEIIADAHALRLPAGLPAGTYPVLVGLYRAGSGARLPVELGGVPQPNDELHLFDLVVEAR